MTDSPTSIPPGNALQLSTEDSLKNLLIIVFIHGFKGNDETFDQFPERLRHMLAQSLSFFAIECTVFPAYETKGDLTAAVARFVEWLTVLTVEREQGIAGSAKIVLCGHSMGGLLAADTVLELANSHPGKDNNALWPNIIACISFDTPYLGLHPSVLKNSVTKAAEVMTTAQTLGSSVFGALAGLSAKKAADSASSPPSQEGRTGWGRWAAPAAYAIGGAVLAGAAGSAWHNREDLGQGYQWVTDHMKFVGNLWDEKALQKRVDDLIKLDESRRIVFRTFYTLLPPTPPNYLNSRTFILLPKMYAPSNTRFLSLRNYLASDEIQAHTGMFSSRTNDGYYELGMETARIICEMIGAQEVKI
ncbi:hypothetical protein AMATHDRAFT_191560 [Amanita thiersii Skay4041]|uniref:DUF676 domain-containing protein n=1 Tax=Amanita thiersii Skay4041 TaxID=703135 RepID=A0A2A9NUF0_9AGAR|nr:hypothetical protein AMATHDRAFT_191560 [Amanita thiersii Skay4041]